jgi:hypothetical protein
VTGSTLLDAGVLGASATASLGQEGAAANVGVQAGPLDARVSADLSASAGVTAAADVAVTAPVAASVDVSAAASGSNGVSASIGVGAPGAQETITVSVPPPDPSTLPAPLVPALPPLGPLLGG